MTNCLPSEVCKEPVVLLNSNHYNVSDFNATALKFRLITQMMSMMSFCEGKRHVLTPNSIFSVSFSMRSTENIVIFLDLSDMFSFNRFMLTIC
jgi:hypothetical protein